ncbi:uncharacterized protein A1O5_01751 [Cladophialophora psammophila CBS 110553]|uniref:Major facilitator superfamily (MFS) profile domain-containing protein n=1 Tax=Cladophialophora psammophila CBS 110553 TaxID=1182543 RepID=W9XCL3_9EURO|nr:uncharacterized protein A1O5_01751 [Cladophialophora psammophila CBS 110553]EXJ75055.1 hypothetical protein A1O5_01751 [Cladophialophora psammophila CBS 110553]
MKTLGDIIAEHDVIEYVTPADDHMGDASDSDVAEAAIGGDSTNELPPRYYLSPQFIATYLSFGLSFGASFLGFVMPANILYTAINPDIGPDPNIIWVNLSFTLCQSIIFPVVGRLSDVFGRRWFYICGNVAALIGLLICGRASNVSMLIAGSTLSGLGGGVQNLGPFAAIAELVPYKHRFTAIGCNAAMLGPVLALAPAIAGSFVAHTEQGWRWCYYFNAILSGVAGLLQLCFYFPPAFKDLHKRRTLREALRKFDIVGLVLFVISGACLLLGISWGGQRYPWKSGPVIGTIVSGGVGVVILLIYEEKFAGDEPLIPMYLFRNRGFVTMTMCSSSGSMVFYALSVLWPGQIHALFTQSPTLIGWLSSTLTSGNVIGQLGAAMLANRIRYAKQQVIFCSLVFTALVGGMAVIDQNREAMAVAFTLLIVVAIAWMEILVLSGGPMMVHESDVGISSALEMMLRNFFSTIAISICVTVYTNKLTSNLASYVADAALASGLPQSSLPSLFTAVGGSDPSAIKAVPGMTPSILQAVSDGTTTAYVKSISMVYLISITFGGLMIISAFLTPAFDDKSTSRIARRLQNVDNKAKLNAEAEQTA